MMSMIKRLWANDRGNILVLFALALPIMIGALGLAVEGSNWYQTKRSLQNAADEAVVAAATNASSNYLTEARAVAAQYGYVHGVSDTTVTASNTATCPTGGSTCYSVTITKKVPLRLSAARYSGNATIGTVRAEEITSTAVATQQTSPREYCILALTELRTNGAPDANLAGCNVMSNGAATCNGHDLEADYGDAVGTNNGCGNIQTSNVTTVSDPYAARASNIPAHTCTNGFPQAPSKNNDPELPSTNKITGTLALGTTNFCGDLQLSGNVTLTGTNVIYIRNGDLDLNGKTITTDTGATATIVFTGDNTAGFTHTPTGSGGINISSPTSGVWSGVALYTDPALTTGVDMSEAGNSPSWNISGLVYAPNADVTLSGVVGKATSGLACFVIVVKTFRVNGTANILDRGQCPAQGLTMPSNPFPARGRLVA